MNDLRAFFDEHEGRYLDKWHHYFEIYDRHFSAFRDQPINVVEFGVSQGGSMQMWKHYFGARANIFGVDINPHCKQLEELGVKIFIGDQEDRQFLRSLAKAIPKIDILIDDGGHTMRQQIHTFEELFPHVAADGVYLVEDLHTSYWPEFGGAYKRGSTFVEYSKNFIDQINAWHSKDDKRLGVSEFTRSAHSLHFYDSVLVIEKRAMQKPTSGQKGSKTVAHFKAKPAGLLQRLRNR